MPAAAQDSNLVYKVTVGKNISYNKTVIRKSGVSFYLKTEFEKDISEAFLDSEFSVLRLQFKEALGNTDYTVKRDNNTLFFKGMIKNQNLEKNLAIDSKPWIQFVEYAFVSFIKSDDSVLNYWALLSKDGTIHEMTATKMGIETISVCSKKERAIHIRVQLAGVLSNFWQSNYWFRTSDTHFVRYEALHGAGAPLTIIELYSESY